MISYYRKAKKEGWKPDQYTAKITFMDKSEFTITIEGNWWKLIEYGVKYSNYSISNRWKIFKNNKELDSLEYYSFWESVLELKERLCTK